MCIRDSFRLYIQHRVEDPLRISFAHEESDRVAAWKTVVWDHEKVAAFRLKDPCLFVVLGKLTFDHIQRQWLNHFFPCGQVYLATFIAYGFAHFP